MIRLILLGTAILTLAFAPLPARAQLVGTDTAPGSSCAGFPDGATRMTADADLDGAQVVLICDGTIWNAAEESGLFAVRVHRGGTGFSGAPVFTVNWSVEDYDTDNVFDLGNDRYQPTRAGYYNLYAQALARDCGRAHNVYLIIQKNGTTEIARHHNRANDNAPNNPNWPEQTLVTSTVEYFNGTTDFVDVRAFEAGCGEFRGDAFNTFFTAYRLK